MTNTMIAKILDMTSQGVGKWRKEDRPIITLIEKYFTKEELEEFLNHGRIFKYEKLKFRNSFEKELFEDVICYSIGDLNVPEFMCNFIIPFDGYEEISDKTKENFIYYLHCNFDNKIDETNEERKGHDELIDNNTKKEIFCEIINLLENLSSREFNYIVASSSHYNPFNNNYLEEQRI